MKQKLRAVPEGTSQRSLITDFHKSRVDLSELLISRCEDLSYDGRLSGYVKDCLRTQYTYLIFLVIKVFQCKK